MRFYLPLLLALLVSNNFMAQNPFEHRFGVDNYYAQYLAQHPEVVQERLELEQFTADFIKNESSNKQDYTYLIPIVFHINDPSNPQKVTAGQIASALEILNEDFSANNSDLQYIIPEFSNIVADMEIQFCLASIDPQGNPTSGITYHYNNFNGREPDQYGSSVKGVSSWPSSKYLNVWVVNEVEGDGSLYNSGWALYPDTWAASQGIDGIIYNHRYLGYEGSSDVNGPNSWQAELARVLTHEVAHYLNIFHTFENYCDAPGDQVNDTPPVYYYGSNNCDQQGTKCSGVTVINDQNYMDYTPCPSMFTEGQKARAIATLNSSIAGRSNLWSEANLVSTGCKTNLSVLENEKFNLTIFPNPSSNLLHIDIQAANIITVEYSITNLLGIECLAKKQTNTKEITIDISSYATGIYFFNYKINNENFVEKIYKP